MKATLLRRQRISVTETAFVEIVIWMVPSPIRGSTHHFKYRLALVFEDICVLRYDNEAGKGDHKHIGESETVYDFTSLDAMQRDFWRDVRRWGDKT